MCVCCGGREKIRLIFRWVVVWEFNITSHFFTYSIRLQSMMHKLTNNFLRRNNTLFRRKSGHRYSILSPHVCTSNSLNIRPPYNSIKKFHDRVGWRVIKVYYVNQRTWNLCGICVYFCYSLPMTTFFKYNDPFSLGL